MVMTNDGYGLTHGNPQRYILTFAGIVVILTNKYRWCFYKISFNIYNITHASSIFHCNTPRIADHRYKSDYLLFNASYTRMSYTWRSLMNIFGVNI